MKRKEQDLSQHRCGMGRLQVCSICTRWCACSAIRKDRWVNEGVVLINMGDIHEVRAEEG